MATTPIEPQPDGDCVVATIGPVSQGVFDSLVRRDNVRSPVVVDLDALDPDPPSHRKHSEFVAVLASTSTDLRRGVSLAELLPDAPHLLVIVAELPAHRRLGIPSPLAEWSRTCAIELGRGPLGEWAVEARFGRPVRIRQFLAALLRGLQDHRPLPVQRVALAGRGVAHWRPGDPAAVWESLTGPPADQTKSTAVDVVLRLVDSGAPAWADTRVCVVDRPLAERLLWTDDPHSDVICDPTIPREWVSDVDAVPPVDEQSVNPIGFIGDSTTGSAVLAQAGAGWVVRGDGLATIAIDPTGAVTDMDVARLRRVRAVTVRWGRHTSPIAAVRTVASLACAGVPMLSPTVPAWASALGTPLIDVLTSVKASDLDDDLAREVHSIRLRRVALRTHSTRARWRGLADSVGLPAPRVPRVSVVLCTRRVDFLELAIEQVARQRHVDLELILTLHDLPADLPLVRGAIAGFDRPLTLVTVPGDVPLGQALNRGAAAASGNYVAKWDDDDWYGPEHLADLMLAAEYTGAELLGCGRQLAYLQQLDATVFQVRGGSEQLDRPVAGGTIIVDRNVFEHIGGFRPIGRGEDTDLIRVVRAAGGHCYRAHGLGYMLHRRETGHTWNPPLSAFTTGVSRRWRGFRPTALMEMGENRP